MRGFGRSWLLLCAFGLLVVHAWGAGSTRGGFDGRAPAALGRVDFGAPALFQAYAAQGDETAADAEPRRLPRIVEGLAWYLVFLVSATFHEAAHSWAAKKGGDLTAYWGGQVSLDPLPHIRREPFGMVVLPVLSLVVSGWPFGFASTPYDPNWADRYPRRAAWMSLAGPGANLALVLLAALAIRSGILFGLFAIPERIDMSHVTLAKGAGSGAAYLFSMLFSLNLMLFVLNLIPFPPLDGSGALALVLGETYARRIRPILSQPTLAWVGLFAAWRLFDTIFGRIFLAAIHLLYPGTEFR